jgi:hypothetical protein
VTWILLIQGPCFIWCILLVTSCHPVYCTSITYLANHLQTQQSTSGT